MLTSFMAGIVAFLATYFIIPYFMAFFQRKKIGGQQTHEDVKQHLAKAGTPTMGGTVFLSVSILVGTVTALLTQATGAVMAVIAVIAIYGLIGFLDDFLKIFRQVNEGLTPVQKLIAQIVAGLIFYVTYVRPSGGDAINVFGWQLHIGLLYIIFVIFWLVGFSNAVNLTDGLDGLASISVVISLLAYGVIAYVQEQYDILQLIIIMIASLIAFFLYNKKPAKIFMGDVGSLSLGAMLAALSIALHQEWTLLLIGLVYVCETSSVMLQVAYFKYTKRRYGEGRRIFRMTPLHHHFELGGFSGQGKAWGEWQVDGFFWLVGLLASLLTLAILYH